MRWHEHARRGLKLAIVACLHYGGVLAAMRSQVMREHAVVLMYHRVRPLSEGVMDYSPNGMTVSPAEFRMQMEFLVERYDVVPLGRIVAAVRGEASATPRLCAVTFDDGWRDVYSHAFPVLKELAIPATVFLTRAFSTGTPWYWEERLKYLLAVLHGGRHGFEGPDVTGTKAMLLELNAGDLFEQSDNRLPRFLAETARTWRSLDNAKRQYLMEKLETLVEQVVPTAPREHLNAAEILTMAKQGIEFGNHSATHANLAESTPEDVQAELSSAECWISETVGVRPMHVAYPYGKFNAAVQAQARQAGYVSGLTTRFGLVAAGADHMALNRVNMCTEVAGNGPLFAARILGF